MKFTKPLWLAKDENDTVDIPLNSMFIIKEGPYKGVYTYKIPFIGTFAEMLVLDAKGFVNGGNVTITSELVVLNYDSVVGALVVDLGI